MKTIWATSLPTQLLEMLEDKETVFAISISGGKDSQALLNTFMRFYRANGLTQKVFAIHADLGRFEWKETLDHCQWLCDKWNLQLIVVRRERDGKEMDLLDRIQERKAQLEGTDKVFWPSAMARYCTSDLKTDPINRYLRRFDKVISLEGIRWDESKARSLKPLWSERKGLATKSRKAFTWNAIIDFTEDDVWATENLDQWCLTRARAYFNNTGELPDFWNFHPAYAMGNTRLSCAICILANKNDFLNGIRHNPELAQHISQLEEETGFTFKEGTSIQKALDSINKPNLFT